MPAEYQRMRGPIAVYVGVIPDWFHFDWLRQAAVQIPDMSFVLIGPDANRSLTRVVAAAASLQLVCKTGKVAAGAKPARVGLITPKA